MKKIIFSLCSLCFIFEISCANKPFLTKTKNSEEAFQECKNLSKEKDYDRANECFEVLKSRFAGSNSAYEADLEIADNDFRKGDYLVASESYLGFAKLHPNHEKIGYAYYRIGLSYLRYSPKAIDRDQQYLESSIHYFDSAISLGGETRGLALEKLKEARTKIAKRHFYIGNFYHRTGEYRSAIPRFQEIVTNYTGLGLDEKSLYLLGDSYLKVSEKEKALEILGVFEKHFPESHYHHKLAKNIGVK